jgi:prolyl-tRNA synthetase
VSDSQQIEVAEKLFNDLNAVGIETLLDDRDERAGVKFKDADLIGIPYRVVPGRSLKNGRVEVVKRATQDRQELAVETVVATLRQWLNER